MAHRSKLAAGHMLLFLRTLSMVCRINHDSYIGLVENVLQVATFFFEFYGGVQDQWNEPRLVSHTYRYSLTLKFFRFRCYFLHTSEQLVLTFISPNSKLELNYI